MLVIDDDPDARRAIAKVLGRHGLAVVTAENGLAAMAAISLHQFGAIVCDIRMEFFDGFQFYDELQTERPDLARRVVFVTAWAHDPVVRAAVERAGRPVVEKPFDIQALVGLVRHVAEDRPGYPGSNARYSAAEARRIRESALKPGTRPTCPCCGGDLAIGAAPGDRGRPRHVWEVRCRRCARTLTLTDVPAARFEP
ncbi:MAG: response regulator [Gemmatimonadetes bacterium]|nr:response regulator [Gemmatimonadota bacterium]